MLRLAALAVVLVAFVGGAGYLLGTFLQAPDDVLAALDAPTQDAQTAPLPVGPLESGEFVESDVTLEWSWPVGLVENQLYALRLWAEDHAYQEIWTAESQVPAQDIIDSFSIDFGKFYWQVAVISRDSAGNFEGMASEWSDVSVLQRLRRTRLRAKAYDDMSAAARQFADRDLSATEVIDAVHLFVHENSKTNEQLSYAPDYSDAIELMVEYSQGESTELPRLLCDGRSTAMLTILKELGIESRLVFLYKSGRGWISEHTVLEVFNPDSQYWQTHDLGGDIYYLAAESGIRPNAESLLFDSRTEIIGCPVDGSSRSAELAASGLSYFEALHYGHTFEVWVNPGPL